MNRTSIIRAIINRLLGRKTTGHIVGGIKKNLVALRDHAKAQRAEAERLHVKATSIRTQAGITSDDALHADRVANKLNELLS